MQMFDVIHSFFILASRNAVVVDTKLTVMYMIIFFHYKLSKEIQVSLESLIDFQKRKKVEQEVQCFV